LSSGINTHRIAGLLPEHDAGGRYRSSGVAVSKSHADSAIRIPKHNYTNHLKPLTVMSGLIDVRLLKVPVSQASANDPSSAPWLCCPGSDATSVFEKLASFRKTVSHAHGSAFSLRLSAFRAASFRILTEIPCTNNHEFKLASFRKRTGCTCLDT